MAQNTFKKFQFKKNIYIHMTIWVLQHGRNRVASYLYTKGLLQKRWKGWLTNLFGSGKQFTLTIRKSNLFVTRLKYRGLKKAACTIYKNTDRRTFFRSQQYHNEGTKSKYLTKNAIQSVWLTKCTLYVYGIHSAESF